MLDIDDVLFLKPVTMPVPELLTDDVLIRGGTFRPEPALLIEEALSRTIRKVSEGAGLDALDLGGVVYLAGVEAFDLAGLDFLTEGGVFGIESLKHFVLGT